MLRLRCFRPGVKTQDLADKKKKRKEKFSPLLLLLESRTLDLVTPRGWLLGYFLLPIFTSSGGKRKKGVVAEHFCFFLPLNVAMPKMNDAL
jgi:hypothetical protein